jgi:hypothetical protein
MMPTRPQKITLAEMGASGVRGLLIYCSDYRCSHWTAISGDRWTDSVRLSDLELRDLPARLAAGVARMWGWTSTGKSNRPAGWAIAEVGQMSHHVFSVAR